MRVNGYFATLHTVRLFPFFEIRKKKDDYEVKKLSIGEIGWQTLMRRT
jgi:hypothetical protein